VNVIDLSASELVIDHVAGATQAMSVWWADAVPASASTAAPPPTTTAAAAISLGDLMGGLLLFC
jgi:hypothetical protein